MTTDEQAGSAARDRHSIILDYLETAPAILGAFAGLLIALTGLAALFVR